MEPSTYTWQFRTRGAGPPMLLLHAFPYDGRMWDARIETLATSHRVYVPDMPGFRGAPGWTGVPSVDAWAASLLDSLQRVGVTSAVVAGCSLGGYLMFALQRAAPDFICGAALIDTRAIADTADRRAARYADAERIVSHGRAFFVERSLRSVEEELAAYPAAHALAAAMLADASDGGLADVLVALATRPDSTAQLASISVPAIVVRGTRDPIVGKDEARGMAASIPNAEFIEIEGAGHIPTFERPDAVNAALLDLCGRSAR